MSILSDIAGDIDEAFGRLKGWAENIVANGAPHQTQQGHDVLKLIKVSTAAADAARRLPLVEQERDTLKDDFAKLFTENTQLTVERDKLKADLDSLMAVKTAPTTTSAVPVVSGDAQIDAATASTPTADPNQGTLPV